MKISVGVALALFLTSCGNSEYKLFDPKGPIANEQMWLIIHSTWIMLLVVVPVIIMAIWFPIKYRKNNDKNEYLPDWEHSNKIEAVVWTIPILIIIALGVITYITSFSLDPRKPIKSDKPAMVVQVVAMDWKWLFIYPEQQIATVNEIAIPVDRPIEFLVTSDTVMNSFFIPNLGSQIYAMSGMENRLHLIASEVGTYQGISANYSGFGFSGMKFSTIVTNEQGFDEWVVSVKSSQSPLDDSAFRELRVKSRDVPPKYFSDVNPLLFSEIIEQYTGGLNGK
ncbi:ubiquinol oxidase subunit II [Kangiella sp. HZ709]|nr:ubiquinol oxidase subunit II [Kangiella sp. HZ709]MRX26827.1 ubiquinol oxidase subunit II [Kangiella sp. HZ709]